jgi:hypothetical protein
MRAIVCTALILAGCASQAPQPTSEPERVGGQRVIDFADRHAVYAAFQDAYQPGAQLMPVPPELENAADAFCFSRAGGRPSRALGIDLGQKVPICYAATPPQSVANRVCKSLNFADAEVEGTVITCRGPVKPSAAPVSPGIAPDARGV